MATKAPFVIFSQNFDKGFVQTLPGWPMMGFVDAATNGA
jgi:hypothetical protein